jgi:predicted outer membrane repeat protein
MRTAISLRESRQRRRASNKRRFMAGCELLEGRQLLSVQSPRIYTVTNLNDSGIGSLRAEIALANAQTGNPAGSMIQFQSGLAGTINPRSTLTLSETDGPEVITGPGISKLTIQADATIAPVAFDIAVKTSANISNMTINGDNNSGAITNSGTLTTTNTDFSNNTAALGGAIYNTGTLTTNNCTFSNNTATSVFGYDGGAIYSKGARTITINNSVFTTNSTDIDDVGTGALIINNTKFEGGSNSGLIGSNAIQNSNATLTINHSSFTNYHNDSSGGDIINGGELTIIGSTFTNSSATDGGAISNSGEAIIANSTFTGNSAISGPNIYNNNTITVVNSTTTGITNSNTGTLSINPPLGLTDAGGIYNGQAYPATANPLASVAPTFDYYDNTTSIDSGSTAPINAGQYTVTANYVAPGGYIITSASTQFTITKANATVVVTPYNVTYDGNAHEATGTATGVGGVTLTGLNLAGTIHTAVGTYTDTWAFSNPNYVSQSGTVVDNIKASQTVLSI